MKEQSYIKMLENIKKSPAACRTIVFFGKAVTYMVYALYPIMLAVLFISKSPKLWPSVIVPAVSFLAVTALRASLDLPRPYEKLNITPLYNKKTHGKSFPSRHTFSVFIIAAAAFYVLPPLGIALGVLGIFLGASRVLSGVHFIFDVVFGAVLGIGFGIVGFYIFSVLI